MSRLRQAVLHKYCFDIFFCCETSTETKIKTPRNEAECAAMFQLGFSRHSQTDIVIVQRDKGGPPRSSSAKLLSETSSYKIALFFFFFFPKHAGVRIEQLLQGSGPGSALLVPVARAVIPGPCGFTERFCLCTRTDINVLGCWMECCPERTFHLLLHRRWWRGQLQIWTRQPDFG